MRCSRCQLVVGLSIGAVLAAAGTSGAADLHFIIFAETLDPTIGTVADLNNAGVWARTIASNTGLNLRLQTLSGSNLTPANARRILQNLNPAGDDVVYFTYSGHGYNAGNSEWPTFAFLTYTGDPYVTFDEVVSTLQPKPQRLLIVLADCCNAPIGGAARPTPSTEPAGDSALTIANFQRLFLGFSGTIRVASASKDQLSLGDSSLGGLFTNVYMDTFLELAGTVSSLTWHRILSDAATEATNLAAYYISLGGLGDIEPQEAHVVIEGEQVAAALPASTTSSNTSTTSDTQTTAPAPPMCGQPGLLPLTAGALWLSAGRLRLGGRRGRFAGAEAHLGR